MAEVSLLKLLSGVTLKKLAFWCVLFWILGTWLSTDWSNQKNLVGDSDLLLSSTAGLWKSITSSSHQTEPDWIAKRTQFWLACSCLKSRPLGNSPTLRYKDFKQILNTWSRVQKHSIFIPRTSYCIYTFCFSSSSSPHSGNLVIYPCS